MAFNGVMSIGMVDRVIFSASEMLLSFLMPLHDFSHSVSISVTSYPCDNAALEAPTNSGSILQ